MRQNRFGKIDDATRSNVPPVRAVTGQIQENVLRRSGLIRRG
jgi:hypothetical protein